jgi:hypothetical protein
MRRLSMLASVIVSAAAIGCSGPVGGVVATTPSPADSPAPTAREEVAAGAPASCPVTKPRPVFVPPARYPHRPGPPSEAWYGSSRLWTALDVAGETWYALPRTDSGAIVQKTFWWSALFSVRTEEQPAISVTGRRLDRPGPTFQAGNPGTNAAFDETTSMLVGIDIPTPGCWELTARYRGNELSYVVWIDDD